MVLFAFGFRLSCWLYFFLLFKGLVVIFFSSIPFVYYSFGGQLIHLLVPKYTVPDRDVFPVDDMDFFEMINHFFKAFYCPIWQGIKCVNFT